MTFLGSKKYGVLHIGSEFVVLFEIDQYTVGTKRSASDVKNAYSYSNPYVARGPKVTQNRP
jgi:hypothetical protein